MDSSTERTRFFNVGLNKKIYYKYKIRGLFMYLMKEAITIQLKDISVIVGISLIAALPAYLAWVIINAQPLGSIIPIYLKNISYLGFSSIFFLLQILNKFIPTFIKFQRD